MAGEVAVPCFDLESLEPERVLHALRTVGAFQLHLPAEIEQLNREVLEWFAAFDSQPAERKAARALRADGSGENNGYHPPGGLSAYNRFREGYIFQADEPIWAMLDDADDCARFVDAHERWRGALHALGAALMRHVARGLELAPDHFDAGGPCDVCAGAQFHLKAIRLARGGAADAAPADAAEAEAGAYTVTMPAHRDPSVISIVFATGPGLQLVLDATGGYVDVERYGPSVCTVFGGQVLSKLSRGLVVSPTHRVVSRAAVARPDAPDRVAAAFFFQPPLDAVLRPIATAPVERHAREFLAVPVPERRRRSAASAKSFSALTYREWKAKTYESYYARGAAQSEQPTVGEQPSQFFD